MKSMNRKEGKKIAVMAAVIMGLMVIAFMPMASAEVTSFTVTPSTGLAGAVDSYNALVTTTGVTSINITIPAGFIAVAPKSGGVLIARVEFWNTSKGDYYGYGNVTAHTDHPENTVNISGTLRVDGDAIVIDKYEQPVDYNPGGKSTLVLEYKNATGVVLGIAWANITLPEEKKDGCINITTDCGSLDLLQDVHIAVKQFVRNPLTAGDYDFFADGMKYTGMKYTVTITEPEGQGIAVFRDGMWYVDTDGDRVADKFFWYGLADDVPVVGDINKDGVDDIAVFRNGEWYVDTTGDHVADLVFWYGIAGDDPVVGDIDQDGLDDIAVFRNGKWYVDTDYTGIGTPVANLDFWYGIANDNPVVGDIDQDGKDDTVVVRDENWCVDTNKSHGQNYDFVYGLPTDEHQLARDINKNGLDDVVVFRDGYWYAYLTGIETYGAYTGQVAYWFGIVDDVPAAGYFR